MTRSTKPIAVFYHLAHMGPQWGTIDREIMDALTRSGLLEQAGVFVRNDCNDVGLWEFPTIDMLHRFAQHHDYHVLYLHSKGVTQLKQSIADWRACMLYWMVERWQECVAKLDAGNDAVGITVIDTPKRHFQGNFWWATTKHIRRLGDVREVTFVPSVANQFERHKAEFWLLGAPDVRVYSPYHHQLNPYLTPNPRKRYVGRAF